MRRIITLAFMSILISSVMYCEVKLELWRDLIPINGDLAHYAQTVVDQKLTDDENCFFIVINVNQLVVWSYRKISEAYYLNIDYLEKRGYAETYVVHTYKQIKTNSNTFWQTYLSQDCKHIENEIFFDVSMPIITGLPMSFFINSRMESVYLPWPFWIYDEADTIDEMHITSPFLKGYVHDTSNYIFAPQICPFPIIK